jgi:hypothetical protein
MNMVRQWFQAGWVTAIAGFFIGITLCVGFALGQAWQFGIAANDDQTADKNASMETRVKELLVRADSAAGGKGVSIATGRFNGNHEALFALDHISGDLFCIVPNTIGDGKYLTFSANIFAGTNAMPATEKGKASDFVLCVGGFDFDGGATGATRPLPCICYVADGNTGNVVGYGVSYNRSTTAGALFPIVQSNVRTVVQR